MPLLWFDLSDDGGDGCGPNSRKCAPTGNRKKLFASGGLSDDPHAGDKILRRETGTVGGHMAATEHPKRKFKKRSKKSPETATQ